MFYKPHSVAQHTPTGAATSSFCSRIQDGDKNDEDDDDGDDNKQTMWQKDQSADRFTT